MFLPCLFIKFIPQMSDVFFVFFVFWAICSDENVGKINKFKPFMFKLLWKETN